MTDWIGLLAGSLLCGGAIVAAMALPRLAGYLALFASAVGLFWSVSRVEPLFSRYGTLEALAASVFFVLAGIAIGYRLTSVALVHLASREPPDPPLLPAVDGDEEALIVLGAHGPERYSMRTVARRHLRLAEGAGIEIPPAAVPFIFLAEKARYRATGGRAPGAPQAEALAERLARRLSNGGSGPAVSVASSERPGALAQAVARQAQQGAARIAVVTLGMEDSDAIEQAKSILDRCRPHEAGVSVRFGSPVWQDTSLAARLAHRIVEAAAEADTADIGAVLVAEGTPPEWERQHDGARTDENYFNQRVRMALLDAGLDDRTVRIAWLQWQSPDVTEAIRHVAALGAKRIIVAPSTIALPSVETAVDLDRAVGAARLPGSVAVTILDCWADDEGFADAAERSARSALEAARNTRP